MGELNRRDFLRGSLGTGALALGAVAARAKETRPVEQPNEHAATEPFIDTNVSLGRWPFRNVLGDETAELVEQLRAQGVTSAWAGHLDGLFHKDVASVNARLAADCRRFEGMLIPFGTVNPMLPAWKRDLRRCHEDHGMPGIRLHPAYHRYSLDDSLFREVLAEAAQRGLIVQLVPWMMDERHQNPLMPVPSTSLGPLAEQLAAVPEARLVVANGFRSPNDASLAELEKVEGAFVDFAKLDVIDGLGVLLERFPAERVLFGSHSPLFYFESAELKFIESAISDDNQRIIRGENARRLLAAATPGAKP